MMRALMCKPTYFDVPFKEEEINVWMDPNFPPDRQKAIQQHKEFRAILKTPRVRISLLRSRRDLFDQVFTCNVAWGNENTFIMANPRPSWRKDEIPIAAQWLAKNRFNVMYLPEHVRFEGQGDIINIGDAGWLFFYGARNSPEASLFLEKMLSLQGNKKPFIPLEIADKRFYHGDLCVRYSSYRNAILYVPDALSAESRRRIENLRIKKMEAPQEMWWQLTYNGRKNFPMNGCYIGAYETFPWDERYGEFPRIIRAWIEKDGGKIILHNFDEFGLSGAGHRCVILFLN